MQARAKRVHKLRERAGIAVCDLRRQPPVVLHYACLCLLLFLLFRCRPKRLK